MTLTQKVRDALKRQIEEGSYRSGDQLPSESALSEEFGFSRTVIRETLASLCSVGLVEPRRGVGVFVAPSQRKCPFDDTDLSRASSVLEMLEFRAAIEVHSAGLAALRRSPAQEEEILQAFDSCKSPALSDDMARNADFAFHLAIARAANNPRFSELLSRIGPGLVPSRGYADVRCAITPSLNTTAVRREHEAIVTSILNSDEDRARAEMRAHLLNSQNRYRTRLRNLRKEPSS